MESVDKLREFVKHADGWGMMHSHVQTINEIADAIEDEAKRAWQDGFDTGFASADDWLGQHEDEMAEHGWVRKNKEHVVAHAAVEVTPRIDWMRMADELDVFTQLVRGFAEQVEEDE